MAGGYYGTSEDDPRWGEYGVIQNGNDAMGMMDSICEGDISGSLLSLYIQNQATLLEYSFVSGDRTAIESVPFWPYQLPVFWSSETSLLCSKCRHIILVIF
jgi:hypothetical protein